MDSLGEIKLKYFYSQHLGPRFESAGITINLSLASEYQFISNVKWNNYDYSKVIEKGIKDGLKDIGFNINNGIMIELVEYEEHDVDSSENAFYLASRILIRSREDLSNIRSSLNTKKKLTTRNWDYTKLAGIFLYRVDFSGYIGITVLILDYCGNTANFA